MSIFWSYEYGNSVLKTHMQNTIDLSNLIKRIMIHACTNSANHRYGYTFIILVNQDFISKFYFCFK